MSRARSYTVPLALGALGLLGAGMGVLMLQSNNEAQRAADAQTLQARLAQITAIPYRVRRWAQQLAAAATKHAPAELGPERFAVALAWVMERESLGGEALRPADPSGTGDFERRPGNSYGELPPDGGGWGRGLMQIDYAAHEFARTGNWRDPASNIDYGATVLAAAWKDVGRMPGLERLLRVVKMRRGKDANGKTIWSAITEPEKALARQTWARFSPLHHALNAYNAGAGNVVRALAQGRDPDEVSTHRYGGSVLAKITNTPSLPGAMV